MEVKRPATWFALLALGLALVGLAVLFALNADSWRGWARSHCWPDNCFCEAPRPGAIGQPANTFSNLAYIALGAAILLHAWARPHAATGIFARHPIYATLYGLATAAIGLGSFWFHGSLTYWGNWADWVGMYAFISLALLITVQRLFATPQPLFTAPRFAATYLALNLILALIALLPEGSVKRPLFGLLVLVTLALEFDVHFRHQPRIAFGWFWAALACLVGAYAVWNLDNTRLWCWPNSLVQGHALWHLLTAASAGLLYIYYRSEQPR